jgi:hypothetical protein
MEFGAAYKSDRYKSCQDIYSLLRHPKVYYHDETLMLSQLQPFTSTANIFPSTHSLPKRSLYYKLSDYIFVCISQTPLASYMSHASHPFSFYHRNRSNTW